MKLLLENWRNYLKESGVQDSWQSVMDANSFDASSAGKGDSASAPNTDAMEKFAGGNRSDRELQIYCDMDGVLVDFEQGVVNQINDDLKMLKARASGKRLQALRAALKEIGRDYVTLDDLRGKSTAVKALRNYMYARVGDDEEFWANLPWMPNGKRLWDAIAKHNPHILTSPMQDGSKRGKQIWIENNLKPSPDKVFMSHEKYNWADESSVLIDDWSKNTVPWAEKGGIAIKHADSEFDQTLDKLAELGLIERSEELN